MERGSRSFGSGEIVFLLWAVLALAALVPIATLLSAALPIFTVVWIGVPLVVVLRSRDAGRVGFRRVPLRLYLAGRSAPSLKATRS